MKKSSKKANEIFEYDLWEMANLGQKTTGLPMVVWLVVSSRKEDHGPRIQVQNNHSISNDVETA